MGAGNAEPTFSSATATRSVAENSAAGVNVGAAVTATDSNNDTLTYSLTGTDASSFNFNTSTRRIQTKSGVTYNFEGKSSYSVTVNVRDSKDAAGNTDTATDDSITVTINLTNVNEDGTVTITGTLSGGSALAASVTDLDGTVSNLTWRWARGNTATGSFSNISGATAASYTLVAADVTKFLRATASYTDPQGSGKSAKRVTAVAVGASNSEPMFSSATATRALPENSAANTNVGAAVTATDSNNDTLTYSLGSGGDNGSFTIVATTGQIQAKSGVTYNFEGKNTYSVTVNVRDSKDSAGNANTATDETITVTINLTNVNEAPVIISGIVTVSPDENFQVTTALTTLLASDVDAGTTLTWSLEGADAGDFTITKNSAGNGDLKFSSSPNFEMPADNGGNNVYNVTAKVTDNGSPSLSDTLSFAVRVQNVNEAPVIANTPATATFAENQSTATGVATFTASDVDAGTTYRWSVESAADGGKFNIGSTTGVLTFKTSPNFEMPTDAGANNVYNVTVKVTDNGSPAMSDTHTFAVTVTNVNEAPVIAGTPATATFAENTPTTTGVATFTASDVDASTTLSWSVESADDGGKFDIGSTTGVLTFKTSPNFEMPTDVGANNVYNVTVKVTDNGSPARSDTHTFAVTVTNVNEAPVITGGPSAFDVDENTADTVVIATYTGDDVDAAHNFAAGTLFWELDGDDKDAFTIGEASGALSFNDPPPNFEMPEDEDADGSYSITVRLYDGSIVLMAARDVVVTVTDVNERPVISGPNMINFPEIEFDAAFDLHALDVFTFTAYDDDGDDVFWDVSGPDAFSFKMEEDGLLNFDQNPDFEQPVDEGSNNTYVIVVEAYDGFASDSLTGTFNVTVTVTNIDETPEITGGEDAPRFAEIAWNAASADLTVETFTGRDEEDGTSGITWSLIGPDTGDLTIDSASGVLSFNQRPNFEMPVDDNELNGYDVDVVLTDSTSNTRVYPIFVEVFDINENPRVTGGSAAPTFAEIEYDLPDGDEDLTVETYTGEDEDVDDMLLDNSLLWSLSGPDASLFTITKDPATGNGVLAVNDRPDFENPVDDTTDGASNTYNVIVQLTDDGSGLLMGVRNVVVTVTNVNEKPELTGTPTASVTLNEHDFNEVYVSMTVADYNARDEEGGVTWSLTGTDRGDFAIDADGAVTFAATPNFEEPEDSNDDNVYTFTVVATDTMSGSTRRSASIDVTITVEDIEEAGTITVSNPNPAAGDTVTFTLTDPDGGIVLTSPSDITWTVQRRLGGGWLNKVTGSDAASTWPYDVDEDDAGYELRALVTYADRRGTGKTAETEATAAVTADPIANAPPRFRGGLFQTIPEGEAGVLPELLMATDRDNDTLTFGLGTGSDAALFEINSSTGQVRVIEALDFETQTGFSLIVPITLHDGKDADGNPDTTVDVNITLSVRVTDVEEEGSVTLSAEEPEEGTPLVATLTDGDGSISGEMWRWARSEDGETGWANISGARSSSYTPTETDGDFFLRARVTYRDNRGGGKKAEAMTTGPVPSENRRPTFPSTEDVQRTVPENTRAGVNIGAPVAAIDPERDRLVYTLTGADADAFTIVASTGQLRTKDALDFETKPSYTFTVEVHDGRDGSGSTSTTTDDSQSVTITVENVEEPGTVTLTTDAETIRARVPVAAELSDDDVPTGITWQWSRSPNGRTGWVNIANTTNSTYTPTLTDAGNYIRATASYTDGHGPNKTVHGVSPRVGEPPPVNSAPAFPSTEDGRREVAEDAAAGGEIGAAVMANDVNAGNAAVNDPLVYSLSGTDAASFTIDPSTGQLRVGQDLALDFEGKRSYRVTVQVTDGRDQNGDDDNDTIDDTINVTVTVTNVNEAPSVTGDTTVPFTENGSKAIATYTARDPERDKLTWSVSDEDNFWISNRGQLYFSAPPSFEGSQTTFEVTVVATDDGTPPLSSDSYTVTVTVTDVEEDGTVTIAPPRGWDGTTFSATLQDDDGNESSQTWQWARSTNRSRWTDITGETSRDYTATVDDVGNYLRVSVEYTDRRSSGKTAVAMPTSRIADAADKPTTNNAPEFANPSETRSIGRGTAPRRSIGAPIRARDTDSGDVLTYSLSGPDAEFFDIDPATGQLRTRSVLDPAVKDTYTVTLNVHDGFDGNYNPSDATDATIDVTITVTAAPSRPPRPPPPPPGVVNRPPAFSEGSQAGRSIAENTPAGVNIGDPLTAKDREDDSLTYSLSGPDSALFAIDEGTGQLRVGSGTMLDYEADDNVYEVTVTATDSSGASAAVAVTISVTDVGVEGMVGQYDRDDNGAIDRDEAVAAAVDYFNGVISKEEAIAVVRVYFAD